MHIGYACKMKVSYILEILNMNMSTKMSIKKSEETNVKYRVLIHLSVSSHEIVVR